MVAASTRKPS